MSILSFTVPSREGYSSIPPHCCFMAVCASTFPCSESDVTSPATASFFSADNIQEHHSSPLGNYICFGLHRSGHHRGGLSHLDSPSPFTRLGP